MADGRLPCPQDHVGAMMLRLVRLGCTAAAACGYGTGVGTAAVTAAGEMHGFPATMTSFIGREEAVRDVARLLAEIGRASCRERVSMWV